jgi:hypothetical protein
VVCVRSILELCLSGRLPRPDQTCWYYLDTHRWSRDQSTNHYKKIKLTLRPLAVMLDGTEQTLAKRQPKYRGKGEEKGKERCETKRAAKRHDEQQQQQQQQEDGDSEPKAKRPKPHTTHASSTKVYRVCGRISSYEHKRTRARY